LDIWVTGKAHEEVKINGAIDSILRWMVGDNCVKLFLS